MTPDEVKNLSINNIVDGWTIKPDGRLYLFVRCPDGIIRTIELEKKGGL